MTTNTEELQQRAEAAFLKYQDAELRDYMLGLIQPLQMSNAVYHHFGYLLTHVRATVAYQSRPPHLQQAIERAQQFMRNYNERQQTSDDGASA
jgi:hypothetical protein